ncbi:MAG: twin-arginine translocase TatA/TatE family subunit [Nitrospinota bacterium]
MFGFGIQEIVIILAVALIFVGPKRIPEVARTLGKIYFELTRHIDDAKSALGQISSDVQSELNPFDDESSSSSLSPASIKESITTEFKGALEDIDIGDHISDEPSQNDSIENEVEIIDTDTPPTEKGKNKKD